MERWKIRKDFSAKITAT